LIREENLQQSTLSSHFPGHQRLPEGMKCDAHGLRLDEVGWAETTRLPGFLAALWITFVLCPANTEAASVCQGSGSARKKSESTLRKCPASLSRSHSLSNARRASQTCFPSACFALFCIVLTSFFASGGQKADSIVLFTCSVRRFVFLQIEDIINKIFIGAGVGSQSSAETMPLKVRRRESCRSSG
jgi:hypothetical protein